MMEFIKRLLKGRKKQCNIHSVVYRSSSEKKQNPYELLWYKQGWSEKRIAINNAKYWQWEMDYNWFDLR